MTETELTGRSRAVARRRGACGPAGSISTSGRSWARSTHGATACGARWRWSGLVRGGLDEFDTLDVGGGFPVLPLGEPAPGPERFARELPALLDAHARRPAAAAPGDRAGPVPRGACGLAGRPGAPRPDARRPPGRARCRDDRADPARALRRPPPDRGADLARPAVDRRPASAAAARPPASRARSASRPTPSAARPAAAPARRPRRDPRRGGVRRVARLDLQRPAAPGAGPARGGRARSASRGGARMPDAERSATGDASLARTCSPRRRHRLAAGRRRRRRVAVAVATAGPPFPDPVDGRPSTTGRRLRARRRSPRPRRRSTRSRSGPARRSSSTPRHGDSPTTDGDRGRRAGADGPVGRRTQGFDDGLVDLLRPRARASSTARSSSTPGPGFAATYLSNRNASRSSRTTCCRS